MEKIKRNAAKTTATSSKVAKLYQCDFCDHKPWDNKRNLETHIRRFHTFEKPFKCGLWDFASVNKLGFQITIVYNSL